MKENSPVLEQVKEFTNISSLMSDLSSDSNESRELLENAVKSSCVSSEIEENKIITLQNLSSVIQRFWRSYNENKRCIQNITDISRARCKEENAVSLILKYLTLTGDCHSYDKCQEYVMNQGLTRSLKEVILKVFPSEMNPTSDLRNFVSAILISNFPEDVLLTVIDDSSNPVENKNSLRNKSFDEEITNCATSAKMLIWTFNRFLKFILNFRNYSLSKCAIFFNQYRSRLYFSYSYYLKCLDTWKKYDKVKMISQLEYSYVQCYSLLLSAKLLSEESQSNLNSQTRDKLADGPGELLYTAETQKKLRNRKLRSLGLLWSRHSILKDRIFYQIPIRIPVMLMRTILTFLSIC
jgi:hypothetical protein